MKWERTDLIVGIVVAATVAMLAGTLLWIVPALSHRTYALYTQFEDVEGIGLRVPVQLHGYRVGYVESIQPLIAANGDVMFRVKMAIDRNVGGDHLVLPAGTEAWLTPPPLPIGAGFIALELPRSPGEPLEPDAVVPGHRAPVAADQLQALTMRLDSQVALTTATARTLMDSLTHTAGLMNQSLVTTQTAIPAVVQGLQAQLAMTEALTTDLRTHLNAVGPSAVAGMDSAALLLADSRRMVQRMTTLLDQSEGEITTILANLDTTSVLVASLVRQFSSRPLGVIFRGAQPVDGYSRPQ